MDDINFSSPDLALTPELRNDFVAIAKEIYKIMEPYRNQSETAVKAMQQAMSSIALPADYFKKWQLDLEVPFAQLAKETAELRKTIDAQLFTQQFTLTVQQASRILQAADGPDTFVPVEEAEELYQQAKPIIPEDAAAAVEQRIEAAKKPGKKLTWHDVLEIITFIFLILNFVKDMLPDKHDQFMESEIVAIRENQEEQIQLMDDMYQMFNDFCDDFAVFIEKSQQADDLVDSTADDVGADGLENNADP